MIRAGARLRPILMTALATMAGMIPASVSALILAAASGAAAQRVTEHCTVSVLNRSDGRSGRHVGAPECPRELWSVRG